MRLMAIVAMLALSGCGQPANNATTPPPIEQAAIATTATPAPNNCPAAASSQWSAGAAAFTIEATVAGASCAETNATITIRDANGAVVHTATLPTSNIQALAGAESVSDMERMLREWITPAGASRDSTGDLPPWAAGEPLPEDGGVPFHPSEGIDRAVYATLRAADAPMYCYELSDAARCFAMRNGALTELGTQSFAG